MTHLLLIFTLPEAAIAYPIVGGLAFVVFHAGRVVERMRNGKYVLITTCSDHRKMESDRWQLVHETLSRINKFLDEHAME